MDIMRGQRPIHFNIKCCNFFHVIIIIIITSSCTHFALSANQFLVKIVNPSWFKKDPLPSVIVATIVKYGTEVQRFMVVCDQRKLDTL